MPDFYGTRVFVEFDFDGDKEAAKEQLEEILLVLIERDDVISCGGEVGPEGILEQASTPQASSQAEEAARERGEA